MHVTTLYAGLLGLLYVALSANVIRRRRDSRVNLGSGGNERLERRIRAHGNFAEYVPLALLLMALAETGGTPAWLVHLFGIALVIGRGLHGYALSSLVKRPAARVGGMVLTFVAPGAAALACLGAALAALPR
jgi:uncharacterized membrane protein YecN with MAPEG domain